jgi:hypothetical protein
MPNTHIRVYIKNAKILNEIVLVFVYLKVTKIVIMEHMHVKKKLAMEAAYWLQFYLPQETAIILPSYIDCTKQFTEI